AAERQLRPGETLTPPEGLYAEFEARFPYPETEDQLRAIEETLGDMASGKPMDRLICGDVGFGKTEVALRAAFITAFAGGQVVVDEEQHFGVAQKERLKQLKADVHVLTLTATPIPRTLQLALSGVREMSIIATPPVDRLAVRTFVMPFDPVVIREAILRERDRGGQIFYVAPRISDLDEVRQELRNVVPEIRVGMAHGRMPASELENVMTAFDERAFDVLLSTNIIESGLDIPTANTLIVHRADMFG